MLVRSRTAPGQPIDLIPSVRPYDDPGVDPFYYRLQRYDHTIVDKTHLPYALNDQRLARLKQLFIEPDYLIDALPTYEPQLADNPFKAFAAIPPRSRYRFMLDDAHFIIEYVKAGPEDILVKITEANRGPEAAELPNAIHRAGAKWRVLTSINYIYSSACSTT
jgi:hypothetical protein